MSFGIAVLISLIFVCMGVKLGFYDMWVLLFNIAISVFSGIFLSPAVTYLPGVGTEGYTTAVATLATAAVIFVMLQGISMTFLTRDFNIPMPKFLDILGSGTLGFLTGFLVWSFICVTLYMSGSTGKTFLKNTDFKTHTENASIPYVSLWCDGINRFTGSGDERAVTEEIIEDLIAKSKPKKPIADPNTPSDPADETDSENTEDPETF